MLLLRLFGVTLVGFWRLIIGIIFGTILYIYCFLYQEQIYTGVHAFSRVAIDWIDHQSYVVAYAKWFELLKIDDKLSFALYVLFGRLAWMLMETIARQTIARISGTARS
ncbi:hypothetical protein [Cohaesibacter haloalkalitolerans]|uniref:hypothetical protein n=1 Tax=Cohaesibacter haloalkalitolerans TaxID=1162980 RepID=UPI000E646997|nr:hypothetical protein [Cohaesibacter haloalkalitolerans]